jgi:hypothetical protein
MSLALLVLAPVLAAPPTPPEAENLYRAAKVGDWVEFTSTGASKVVMRQSVTAKTEDSLTLKLDQTVDSKTGEPFEQKIDLKGAFPPPTKPDADALYTMKTETLGTGKEGRTIGGKKYDCEWKKEKTTITPKGEGQPMTIVTTVWRCADVPLGGAVRIETESGGHKTVTELTGFGRGK